MPVFVASAGGIKKEETFSQGFSSHAKINPMGGNLFGAVYNYIQALILKAEPFQQTALHKIKESLHVHATIKTQVTNVFKYIYLILLDFPMSLNSTLPIYVQYFAGNRFSTGKQNSTNEVT